MIPDTFKRKLTTKEKFLRLLNHNYMTIISYSGKGGTGKTLSALNIAEEFAREGFDVGLVDIDIEMNSVARSMGLLGHKARTAKKYKQLLPEEHAKYPNLKIFTLSLMPFFENKDEGESVFWGGEYKREYVFQMVFDVHWGKPDVMVFDMPAGISDAIIALTNIYKKIDYCIVTGLNNHTSTDGMSKAIMTCVDNGIEILGVVANEDYCVCPKCKFKFHPKGKGRVKQIAEKYGVDYAGGIPLSAKVCRGMETGEPFLDSPVYRAMFLKAVNGSKKLSKKYRKLLKKRR